MTIRAIYENGIFRPTGAVDLPEKTSVVFEPRVVPAENAPTAAMGRIYEIMSRRYETSEPNLAERHDELHHA